MSPLGDQGEESEAANRQVGEAVTHRRQRQLQPASVRRASVMMTSLLCLCHTAGGNRGAARTIPVAPRQHIVCTPTVCIDLGGGNKKNCSEDPRLNKTECIDEPGATFARRRRATSRKTSPVYSEIRAAITHLNSL